MAAQTEENNPSEYGNLYLSIFENCQFGLIVLDSEQRIVNWNPWVAKFSRRQLHDVQGIKLDEVFPGVMDGGLGRAVKVALTHGMSSVISYTLNPHTFPLHSTRGTPINQQLIVKPLAGAEGKRQCLIQINDVTAAVSRDKQLLENVAELSYQKYALDQHAIVAVTDVNGSITYVNDLFCSLSQYSREELLGANHRLINSGRHDGEFFQDMYRCITNGKVWRGNICNKKKQGDLYWLSTTIVPDRDENGQPLRYFAISTDITERKYAEEAANAATIAKSQFLANMSHEIRTPMNAILGLTRQVMETELNPSQRDQLNKVWRSGQALVRIINDILDFSRFESSQVSLERLPLQLETVVLEVSDLFSAQMDEKGLAFFVDIDPATPLYIIGDALRLTQILNNLVGNAVKFTASGEIYLEVYPEAMDEKSVTLRFNVKDTGIGIQTEHLAALFNPFVQADNSTTRKYGGSGLGLSIVKKLVELMGGQIAISSEFGQGTCVSFTLKAGLDAHYAKTPFQADDLQQLQGKRVLIWDNHEASAHIVSRLLSAWGMQLVTTQTAEDALRIIDRAATEQQPFYAVLLDWNLLEGKGAQLLAAIKSKVKEDSHKVLVMTGTDKQVLLNLPEARFVDGVLMKPVVPSVLFDALLHSPLPIRADIELADESMFDDFRVLLVEDHDLNQEVAVNFLQKRGVQVTVAWNGAEAVDLVREQAFDLVLMDLHMPVMGGYEATRLIRELPKGANLPIVAMTAAVLEDDRKQCFEVGMDDFVAKPVEPTELTRVLNRFKRGDQVQNPLQAAISLPVKTYEVLDLVQSLNRLDGDERLLQNLLSSFCERYADVEKKYDELMMHHQVAEAVDLIHGLKGVSANLGAMALSEECGHLVDELRAGSQTISKAIFVARLNETFEKICHYLLSNQLVDTRKAPSDQPSPQDVLPMFESYVFNQEVMPDELQSLLRQLSNSDLPSAAQFRELQQTLDHFDHSAAQQIFQALKTNLDIS